MERRQITDEIHMKKVVRETYASIAQNGGRSCCGGKTRDNQKYARFIGYSGEELATVPDGANLGVSCGNPTAIASLREGEVLLDLGSGAGFDCFIAAAQVGQSGKIIGVDMTPQMVEKARENAKKAGVGNVEFRLGEIENLPVADSSVDVVISNCVINLSTDKKRVFQEIMRVLKPGGRIAVSDLALLRELPEQIKKNVAAYTGCVAGAVLVDDYRRLVEDAGLKEVKVTAKGFSLCSDTTTADPIKEGVQAMLEPGESISDYVASVSVEGYK
jgi:SAM-dependent methyltransferase